MEIYFRNKKLQESITNQAKTVKEFGPPMARKIHQRMEELSAADTLSDLSHLPPTRCHQLTGNRKGIFSVDLTHPYRLLFEPYPRTKTEDRDKITAIIVIEIKDTH